MFKRYLILGTIGIITLIGIISGIYDLSLGVLKLAFGAVGVIIIYTLYKELFSKNKKE